MKQTKERVKHNDITKNIYINGRLRQNMPRSSRKALAMEHFRTSKYRLGFVLPVPPDVSGITNEVKWIRPLMKFSKYSGIVITTTENPLPIDELHQPLTVKSFFPDVFREIGKNEINLLHVQYIYGLYGLRSRSYKSVIVSFTNIIILCLYTRMRRKKLVLTMHRLTSSVEEDVFDERYKKLTYLNFVVVLLNRLLIFLSSATTVLSNAQLEKITSGKSKVYVVPEPVTVWNTPKTEHDQFTFIYHGFIKPSKGLTTLLEAYSRLRKVESNVKLIVVGGLDPLDNDEEIRSYYYKLKSYIESNSQSMNIEFHSRYVDDEVLFSLISLSDVAVFPYIDMNREISGAIGKIMDSGLAFICSKTPRFETLLVPGEDALFFEPGDSEDLTKCMLNLIWDESLRERITDNLNAKAKSYYPDIIAEKYAEIYRNLLPEE